MTLVNINRLPVKKRLFLASAGLATLVPSLALSQGPRGPAILTVSGLVDSANRGPHDPAIDQLMTRHGTRFDRAFEFDAAMIERLPTTAIVPTLEYDGRPHRLSGPLLSAVVQAAGVAPDAAVMLSLRGLDGYTVGVTLADARAWRMIAATHVDGRPMGVGGLGPLWGVYDADRLPAFKDKPLNERYALCPWGLYAIEVRAQRN